MVMWWLQGRGDIGTPVDVWALGCVLYTHAYQAHPFDAGGGAGVTSLAVLNAKYTFPALSSYSGGVKKLITAALTPEPARRPPIAQLIPLVTRAIADNSESLLSPVAPPNGRVGSNAQRPQAASPYEASASFDTSPSFDIGAAPATSAPAMIGDLLGSDDLLGAPSAGQGEGPAAQFDAGGWASFDSDSPAAAQPSSRKSFGADEIDLFGTQPTPPPASMPSSQHGSAAAEIDLFGLDVPAPAMAMSAPASFADLASGAEADFFGTSGTPSQPQASHPPQDISDNLLDLGGGGGASTAIASSPDPLADLMGGGGSKTTSSDPMADLMAGLGMRNAPGAPVVPPSSGGFGSLDPMGDLMGGGGPMGGGMGGGGMPAHVSKGDRAEGFDFGGNGDEPSLCAGGTAVIHGLQAKPEFNGKVANLLSFDVAKQRWNVNSGGVVLALKAQNLVAGGAVKAAPDSIF